MTLTKEEIEMIEREVKEKYSCPYTTEDLRSNDAEYVAHINRCISDTILLQIGYKDADTKYLLQLKQEKKIVSDLLDQLDDTKKLLYAERERAGKLVEALDDLMKGVAGLPPLTAIRGVLEQQYLAGETAINEYNNKP